MKQERPEIFVLGGPNGAGKSTVAKLLLPPDLQGSNFVNADAIATQLSPMDPAGSAFRAGRTMIRRVRELRARRERFAFESTLASRMFAPFLLDAEGAGYRIHVIYVSLSRPGRAIERVQLRVRQGGHGIPKEIIRRRYARSLNHFFGLYRPLADRWTLCDNSGGGLRMVAFGNGPGVSLVLDPELWRAAKQRAGIDAEWRRSRVPGAVGVPSIRACG